jgi:hypothetical protein
MLTSTELHGSQRVVSVVSTAQWQPQTAVYLTLLSRIAPVGLWKFSVRSVPGFASYDLQGYATLTLVLE